MGYRIVSILTIIILMFAVVGLAASESGAEVFNSRCASCHGLDGAGKTKATKTFDGMPDLRAAAVQGKTDAQLFETIGRGVDHKKYPHIFLQTGVTPGQLTEVV